jgi:hypothetical protein
MPRSLANAVFHRTMVELEEALTCDLIASRIDFLEGVKRWDASDEDILAYAVPNRFSRVALSGSSDGQEITGVAVVSLKDRTVQRDEIDVGRVVAATTPIGYAIHLVVTRRFLFVKKDRLINKILTVSDLNKLPTRVYLAALVLHFESMLADLIADRLADEDWLALLVEERQQEVLRLQRLKVSSEIESRLVDCASLKDKIIVATRSQVCREALTSAAREFSSVRADRVRELRNAVLHPSAFASWKAVRRLSDAVQDVRAWIDHLAAMT